MSDSDSSTTRVLAGEQRPVASETSRDAVVFRGDGEPKLPGVMIERMRAYHDETGYESDDFSRGGTVEKLERYFARTLGKESAMFFPTGTLANHLAIRKHCGPSPRAIVQEQSHLYNDTGDSVTVLSGINLVPLGKGLPSFTAQELEAALEHVSTGRVASPVGAVMVESPVRRQAGQTMAYGEMQAITGLCRDRGIPTHLDGARLFMMAAADGRAPAEYASLFDTVYVSLYKYFGTPFGGILAGTAEFVRDLYHDRRMFGSGLASSALIAGLALKGTEGFEERFAEAMARAGALFDRLNALPGIAIRPFEHGSNIFPMGLSAGIDAEALASSLAEKSVFVYPENTWEGSTLLHVNTTVLRKSVDELFHAFLDALELARTAS